MSAPSIADSTNYASMFSTRLFMPGWWVRAFDTAIGYPQGPAVHAIDMARQMQILPALDLSELNALAAVTSEMQEQLLQYGDRSLRIDPEHFEKHASTTNRNRVYAFAKVLQWLPALRLLRDSGKRIEATPLFTREQWLKEQDHLTLEVQLHELGAELLLGYTCSHLELLRRAGDKPLAQVLLGEHAPLGFWRSAWMELQGVEQAFLVRLEKAMQWESQWLHFDGIFGKSLSELVTGLEIKLPKRQRELRSTKLSQVQWLLERIGKKLFHQGLLRLEVDDEYLALNEQHDRGTLLVWQVTAQKAMMEEVERYQSECMRFLQQSKLLNQIDRLVRILAPDGDHAQTAQMGRHLITENAPLLLEPIAHAASAAPVLPIPTFLEWRSRQQQGHALPLPKELADSDAAKFCLCDPEDVIENCLAFARAIQGSLDLRQSFHLMPETTISQMRAWSVPAVSIYLAQAQDERPYVPSAKAPVKPSPSERPPPQVVPDQKLAPVRQSINLRRVANEELTKLRQHEPTRYRELKQTYLDSLDESRRKLILDLQGRVSPEHFDNHLRGSLVKYMIENPSVWKSAKAPPKQAPNRH